MKTAFFRKKFGDCDTKKLFRLVKNPSVEDKGRLLPRQDLANGFSAYFANKVVSIRRGLTQNFLS